jgi:tryptophan-rich sensory protein
MGNLQWKDSMIVVPLIIGLISTSFMKNSKDAGVIVNARPPPAVFGIVWTILYILIGFAWWIELGGTDRKPTYSSTTLEFPNNNLLNPPLITNAMFFLLNFLLLSWVIVYSSGSENGATPQSKKSALYILPICILVTIWIMIYSANKLAKMLMAPLLVWLIFAMLISFEEVNRTP